VPDEVAVLDVDNDNVQCALSNPPLSSIDPNARTIGYESACLLQRLLEGKPPPAINF
jgi:LacI family transcriptional regulator